MLFSSLVFLTIFLPLPLTLLSYYLSPTIKFKNHVLLVFSLLFYAWGEPVYIINIFITIVLSYYAAIIVEKTESDFNKRIVLSISIFSILSLLFYFKYFNFVVDNLNYLFLNLNYDIKFTPTSLVMPIGISFYSFQAISYIVDVYRQQIPSQKNLSYLALYISLFPQLIAGPIVRYKDIFVEIIDRKFTVSNLYLGSIRFIQGLTKKILIANTMGELADHVFSLPSYDYDFVTCWLGAICYTLQLYFDFSGYSDMAIGLGRMFGFTFLENFNYPYISKSITEFWRRWHISLSSWFRDYVYIPLGGNRVNSEYKLIYNILTVFLLTGIWHGANWTFIVWGLWHGLFVVLEKIFKSSFDKLPIILRHIYTMLIVIVGWVIFRSDSMTHAMTYINALFTFDVNDIVSINSVLNRYQMLVLILGSFISIGGLKNIGSYCGLPGSNSYVQKRLSENFSESFVVERAGYKIIIFNILNLFLLLLCFVFLIANTFNPFIYFRF